jgi:hypothetical protein
MYRCFVRFSLNSDDGTLTTYLSNLLTGFGFSKVGTGEYQAQNLTSADWGLALGHFWAAVANPHTAFPGANIPAGAKVDHIWSYSGTM